MGRRANSFSRNNRFSRTQTRAVVTALVERDDHLLMVQLASGPFAGFWLLPSATVEEKPLEDAARDMLFERAGLRAGALELVSVLDEPRPGAHVMRFVFLAGGDGGARIEDSDIARAQWFSRQEALAVLEERDVVPTLAVMSLVRAWARGLSLRPLELLLEDALCPCGSGYRFPGCCGWDSRK